MGLAAQASAVDVFPACEGSASKTEVCQNINPGKPGTNPIIKGLKVAIIIISSIVGVAAVIMIIVAGLAFITANGDAQAVARARGSIIYALIGLVIVALAQSLVFFILNKL
jgi:hypothetical protein